MARKMDSLLRNLDINPPLPLTEEDFSFQDLWMRESSSRDSRNCEEPFSGVTVEPGVASDLQRVAYDVASDVPEVPE